MAQDAQCGGDWTMNGCEMMKCTHYYNGRCTYPGETCKYRGHSSVQSTALLACTDGMLQAAVDKAVENGLLPKAGFHEVIADNWRRMEECINAALQAKAESEVSE